MSLMTAKRRGAPGSINLPITTGAQSIVRAYFADSIATRGPYGHVGEFSAFYDATGDKTWAFWEGWDGTQRVIQCRLFDHDTQEWGSVYTVSTDTMEHDDHGQPSACMDADGYVHVAFGVHAGLYSKQMRVASTGTARDPSTFANGANFGNFITYPSMQSYTVSATARVGWIARQDLTDIAMRSGTVASGTITWDAIGNTKIIAENSGTLRWYPCHIFQKGSKFYIAAQETSTASDTVGTSRNVYMFVYDPSDDTVANVQGTYSEAIPTVAADKANFMIAETTSYVEGEYTADFPMAFEDSNGHVRIYWSEGAAVDGGTSTIYEKVWNGTTLSSATAITTRTGSGRDALIVHEDASAGLHLYYSTGGTSFGFGDTMRKMYKPAAGSWGTASTVLGSLPQFARRGQKTAAKIKDARDELHALFYQFTRDPDRSSETIGNADGPEADRGSGGCVAYAYGTSGWKSGGISYPSDDYFHYVTAQMDFSRWPGGTTASDESLFRNQMTLRNGASVTGSPSRLVCASAAWLDWPSKPLMDRVLEDRDFCWEFGAIEFDDFSARHKLFGPWNSVAGRRSYFLQVMTDGDVELLRSTNGTFSPGTTTLTLGNIGTTANTNMDLCIQKNGTTYSLFKNGAFVGSQTLSGNSFRVIADPTPFGNDGTESTTTERFRGSLGWLRTSIVARYPASGYTAPTSPLPTRTS